jgi:hypothetical protein
MMRASIMRSKPWMSLRRPRAFAATVFVATMAASAGAAASDAGSPCSSATSEGACLANANCAWGQEEEDAGLVCFDVGGPTVAQPGSGDPGGGGSARVGSDDGCAMSVGPPSSARSLVPMFGLILGIIGLKRRQR